ncbi:4Fe-4S dicluster domain-containing protein [archaeon]|nr:4Fe-4S dicluster domain-containing protein [archaeon]
MKLTKEILKNIIKKPATRNYPSVKQTPPKNYRGKISHNKEKCIYCSLCEKNCPSGAITVDRENKTWTCDYSLCTFCSQCVEECDKIKCHAIKLTDKYELAKPKKDFNV